MSSDDHEVSYTPWRAAHGLVFTAGQVGVESDGTVPVSFEREVHLALASLKATLEDAGASMETLLSVRCILSDMADFDEFDAVYRAVVPQPLPPRATHGGALVGDYRVEIIATAQAAHGQ